MGRRGRDDACTTASPVAGSFELGRRMHPVERVEHSRCIEARFVVAHKVHPSSCALSIDACTFLNFHPLPTSLLTLCESRRSDRRPDLRRRLDALSLSVPLRRLARDRLAGERQ
jgi:hypothetical protein